MSRLRTRLPALLGIWGGAALAEVVLYYSVLNKPYFRAVFAPFAVVVIIAAVVWTGRVARPRADSDRRTRERRADERRAGE